MEDNVTEKRMENKMTDPLQTFKESAREIATELHDTGGHYLLTDKQFDALTAAAQAYGDARYLDGERAALRETLVLPHTDIAKRLEQLEARAALAGSTTNKEDQDEPRN